MSSTILLVGESNPYGSNPDFALYPYPDNSAGHRLCTRVLNMSRAAYLKEFDRTNLCAGKWSMKEARDSAAKLRLSRIGIVALGSKVSRAFGLKFEPFKLVESSGVFFAVLPHPSGLNRIWNDPLNYSAAKVCVDNLRRKMNFS